MPLTSGARLGPYEIVGALGKGGMGEVYQARDTRLDRTVAIKALPQAFAADPGRLARFEREAKLLASLNHPNIAGIHGILDSDGVPHLVLEFVSGETLAARLARGPLATPDALAIASQIASAMEAAHERGVIHRDLKPGNVMVTPAGAVKVLDFGIAKDASTGHDGGGTLSEITSEGAVIGTAAYMSPEQARGQAVDRRADVWAFGCILFESFAGKRPFAGPTLSDIVAKVLERDPDWNALPAATPARLRDMIRRCLQKNVAERPEKIGDLRRELSALAEESKSRSGTERTLPSLAVLYFENISNDPDSDYFCAGITEDILTDLSKLKGLRVASRNAVARFRGAAVDIPRVAAELGVSAVMEGSVRRAGDRVRISAQLINAADGFHLWAERYVRTMQDVFAVQEEIASSIASALRVALTPAESQELQRDRPADVRAYDLYLKGRTLYGQYSQESLHHALELFVRATQIEPNYALAWAGIADCYGQLVQWGASRQSEDLLKRGLEAARRAIALDPKLAEAHKAHALILMCMEQMEESTAALHRAVEANPRYVPAWINLGVYAFRRCNLAEAERLYRRAIQIDSRELFAVTWLAQLLFLTGRYEEGLSVVEELKRQAGDPFYGTGAACLEAAMHLGRGDLVSARRVWSEALGRGLRQSNIDMIETILEAKEGHLEEAGRRLAVADSTELGLMPLNWALEIAVMRGDMTRATEIMKRPMIGRLHQPMLRLIPALHPLLDLEAYGPRRLNQALVWPKEAPPPRPDVAALFESVRFETGLPEATS